MDEATVPPPPPVVQAPPAATRLPLPSIETQFPLVIAPLTVANAVVLPERVPCASAEAPLPIKGRLAVKVVPPVPPVVSRHSEGQRA